MKGSSTAGVGPVGSKLRLVSRGCERRPRKLTSRRVYEAVAWMHPRCTLLVLGLLVVQAGCSEIGRPVATAPDSGTAAAKDATTSRPDADSTTVDSGAALDSGSLPDADVPFDGGVADATPEDGGTVMDAAAADATVAPDAAPEDVGDVSDSGVGADMGTAADAAAPMDTGFDEDAGDPSDGGGIDRTCYDVTDNEACGGDPVGTWDYIEACGPSDVETQILLRCPSAMITALSGANLSGDLTTAATTYSLTFSEDITVDFVIPLLCASAVGGCFNIPFALFGVAAGNTTCSVNAQLGCDCAGTVPLRIAETGSYVANGGVITTTAIGGVVTEYNYCADPSGELLRYRRRTVGASYVLERR